MDPTDVSTAGPGNKNRWSLPASLFLSSSKGQGLDKRQAQKTLHHNTQREKKESFAIRVVETWNRQQDRVKPESFKKELNKIIMAWTQKERMEECKEARR